MKLQLFAASLAGLTACSPAGSGSTSANDTTTPHGAAAFLPMASVRLTWADGGPFQAARLPVLVRRNGKPCIAALHLIMPTRWPGTPEAEARKVANEVTVPVYVVYVDARTGSKLGDTGYLNEARPAHFGIPDPAGQVVGHWDDPNALPQERIPVLVARIHAALDTLLPLYADENRPWTEEATKAAREVRDLFPLAAEPGLWPYYRAEGRELFDWVEKHAAPR